jgi:hypothetical protein
MVAIVDLGIALLKLMAVLGGVGVGWVVSGFFVRVTGKLLTLRQVPRPVVRFVQLLGGVALGFAVWLWVTGTGGGFGFGGGGFGGGGPGGTGARTTAPDAARGKAPAGDKDKGGAGRTTSVQVTMLGGERVREDRFYLLDGEQAPRTLGELKDALQQRRQKDPDLKELVIVVEEASVARNHPAVLDLQRWAREEADLAVVMK